MWWSPDSRKLAYYRFDEKQVPDYYLQLEQTKLYSRVDTEAYPKSGEPNPVVDLFVYDVATKSHREGRRARRQAVRQRRRRPLRLPRGVVARRQGTAVHPHEPPAEHPWSSSPPDPATGACRVIVRDEWPTGWVETNPTQIFLKDGRRFIWASERNGWRNYYLYDLAGKLITPLTNYTTFEAANLVKIDEDAKVLVSDGARRRQLPEAAAAPRGPRREEATCG